MNDLGTPAKRLYYLEDVAPGDKSVTGKLEVTEAAIKQFAGEFDPQPFHLDDAAAARTLFGGLAASGWHTAAITMRLLVTSDFSFAWGIIGAGGDISWPRPTRAGDVLQATITILSIEPSRSRADRGMVTVETLTRNQAGQVVQRFIAKLIVPRRPPASA